MTRSVECVLVGTGDKASSDAIEVMKDFVWDRFQIQPVVFDGGQAKKAHVCAAVTGAARRCRAGGLFLLMFSGHGGFTSAANYWQLVDEQLRDDELLGLLGHFELGVEIVVISDCCYGAGMLHAGVGARDITPRGSERLDLGMLQRARLEDQLRDRWRVFARAAMTERSAPTPRPRESPVGQEPGLEGRDPEPADPQQRNIVLISATDWLMIRSSAQNQFVRALAKAVNLAKSYGELREKMISVMKPEGQSNWNVQSEPVQALALPPMSP